MRSHNDIFATSMLVSLKDDRWLQNQRIAGKIASDTLLLLEQQIKNQTTQSLLELNQLAEDYILDHGGLCTFKGYKGFPSGVCISVNKQLVHGIPSNYQLKEGDVVSFDLGVTINGAIADTAITCIYGKPKYEQHVKLIQATEQALTSGIEAMQVGKQLGCIGEAIHKVAKTNKFAIITNYGGHGLDWNVPHASPFVANKAKCDEGIRIVPGLSIAIEPMLVIGSDSTKISDDGWTVCTNDIGAHFEHSIFVHEDRIEIITDRTRNV